MWSRRGFLGRLSAGMGALAVMRPDGLDRVLAAGRRTEGLDAQEVAKDEDFWFDIQRAFSSTRSIINLNNGGVSPSPRMVTEAFVALKFAASAGVNVTDSD